LLAGEVLLRIKSGIVRIKRQAIVAHERDCLLLRMAIETFGGVGSDAVHGFGEKLHDIDMRGAIAATVDSAEKSFLKEVVRIERSSSRIYIRDLPQPGPVGGRQRPDRILDLLLRQKGTHGIARSARQWCRFLTMRPGMVVSDIDRGLSERFPRWRIGSYAGRKGRTRHIRRFHDEQTLPPWSR
jgi:hypothetical protein